MVRNRRKWSILILKFSITHVIIIKKYERRYIMYKNKKVLFLAGSMVARMRWLQA